VELKFQRLMQLTGFGTANKVWKSLKHKKYMDFANEVKQSFMAIRKV